MSKVTKSIVKYPVDDSLQEDEDLKFYIYGIDKFDKSKLQDIYQDKLYETRGSKEYSQIDYRVKYFEHSKDFIKLSFDYVKNHPKNEKLIDIKEKIPNIKNDRPEHIKEPTEQLYLYIENNYMYLNQSSSKKKLLRQIFGEDIIVDKLYSPKNFVTFLQNVSDLTFSNYEGMDLRGNFKHLDDLNQCGETSSFKFTANGTYCPKKLAKMINKKDLKVVKMKGLTVREGREASITNTNCDVFINVEAQRNKENKMYDCNQVFNNLKVEIKNLDKKQVSQYA